MRTSTLISKRQFKELHQLSIDLLEQRTEALKKQNNTSFEMLNQSQWMFNGALELITKAFTETTEGK